MRAVRFLTAAIILAFWTASCTAPTQPTPAATSTPTAEPRIMPASCDIYPIVINNIVIVGPKIGDVVSDLHNAPAAMGFDWLALGDSRSDGALLDTLQSPPYRDLSTLPNLDQVHSHGLLADTPEAHAVLDALESRILTVPVWSSVASNLDGSNLRYNMQEFVWIQIAGYQLGDDNRLSIRYLGPAVCPPPTPVPGASRPTLPLDTPAAVK
jgi:hypothetical protein